MREHPRTRPHALALALAALTLTALAPAWSQDGDTEVEPTLSVAEIDSRLAALPESTLEEAQRAAAQELYTKAKGLLIVSKAALDRKREFEAATAEAPKLLETVRAELARPPEEPVLNVTRDALVSVLEQGLAEAEAQRNSAKDRLDDLRNTLKRRDTRRGELAQLIAAAAEAQRRALEALASPPPEDQPPELRLAEQTFWRAQREQAQAERDALQAEQDSYQARAELLPARMDLARRRLSQLEAWVTAWRERAGEARRQEAQRATEEARQLRLETAVQRVPSLRLLALDNEQLALERSDPEGLAAKIQEATQSLANTRDELAKLRERFFVVRRKIEAAGLTNAMARLLRREYERLPEVDQIERRRSLFAEEVSDTQLRLIELEEERQAAGDVEAGVLQVLADPAIAREGLDSADVESAARRILTSRKDTMAVLVRDYTAFLMRLLDIGLAERELSSASTAYRAYIEERILWVRSVTGSTLPNPVEATEATGWLLSPTRVRRAFERGLTHARKEPMQPLLFILALLISMGASAVILRRGDSGNGISFARTMRSLFGTLTIAAPIPLAVLGVSRLLLAPPEQSEWGLAVGAGLEHVAVVGYCLSALWLLASPTGLAVQQFHWKPEAVSHLRRHLLWFGPLASVTLLISVALDQQEMPARSESLGRTAFVVGELGLAWLAQRWFRQGSPLFAGAGRSMANRLRRLYAPILIGGPLLLAVIALWGFYYTALSLTRSLELSLILVGVLVVIRALFLRWFLIARRRLAREQAERRAQSASQSRSGKLEDPGPAGGDKAEILPEDQLDLAAIKAQVDKLVRGALVVAGAVGLLWIWGDALPALRRLEQVQLYPEMRITEAKDPLLPKVLTGTDPQPHAGPVDDSEPGVPKPGLPMPMASASAETPAAIPSFGVVTLADLLLALLVLGITLAASRNVPALLEVALLQHLPVDAGARYAVITIVRYVIVIVGSWSAAGAIGITWASIQWLAAALTFGLAFGLQEIFANFVSGLIIFGERPVNIGDVVTVGAVTGRVSRIKIRAITIVDLDRKELIVPNREFVTGHVINWTLTDNVLRGVIPVGVAYGTDARRVRELLLRIAKETPLVLADPAPSALFVGFGASSLDFELRVFVAGFDPLLEAKTQLLERIQRALKDEGIEVPFPQRDLHIRSGLVPPEQTPAQLPAAPETAPGPSVPAPEGLA